MCGRFLLSLIPEQYLGLLRIDHAPPLGPEMFQPRMNIAPTQQILIARNAPGRDGERELASVRWGMTSPWAEDEAAIKRPIFNARSETAWEKPMFKQAARTARCVIPADGFYEWKKPESPKGRKQPFLIQRADRAPMLLAGLWSAWVPRGEQTSNGTENCAILTTAPNDAMRDVHNRMPVILASREAADRWLSDQPTERAPLADLMEPAAAPELRLKPIEYVGDSPRTKDGRGQGQPTLFD